VRVLLTRTFYQILEAITVSVSNLLHPRFYQVSLVVQPIAKIIVYVSKIAPYAIWKIRIFYSRLMTKLLTSKNVKSGFNRWEDK